MTPGMSFTSFILPQTVHALTADNAGALFGLGTADPKQILVNSVNTVLGLLGIIAVVVILIGGFRWMLSMGDDDRIARAKKTISGAIIGLVLILLSWAIVNFVLHTASNITGAQ